MIDEKLIHSKVSDTLYIHESFSSMFHGMLNWFQSKFEPRFAYKVVSTYDKAVQFFKSKQMSKDGTVQTNILPSITLDPELDFTNEERSGRFLWMFPTLNSLGNRAFCYKVNLRDQGVTVSIMHTRYSGTCNVTFWLSSIYELMDFRTKVVQFCGGTGRWIRPDFFWSHIILPKEIVEFKRDSDNAKLDWSATPLELIQLNTVNSKEYALPYPINAIWKLDSLSDGSTKYGADQLTEWRFTATFTWEANIPTWARLDNFSFNDMKIVPQIHASPTYSSQPLINRIPMVDSISRDEILKNIINSKHIFCVDTEEVMTDEDKTTVVNISPFVKFDETQCHHYPQSYEKWNHIVSGKITDYDYIQDHPEILNEDFIFLIENYNSDLHDDYLRRAKGCLCQNDDSSSEFYTRISGIRLSTLCHFDKRLYNALKNRVGEDITIDSICKLIYNGIHKSKVLVYNLSVDKTCYDVCNDLVTTFQNNAKCSFNTDKEYKRLDFGESSIVYYDEKVNLGRLQPNTRSIELPHLVSIDIARNVDVYVNNVSVPKDCYDILGKVLTFNDDASIEDFSEVTILYKGLCKCINLELVTNYIMTKTDERDFLVDGKRIEIELPDEYDEKYIKCCSYNGILDDHSDYEYKDGKVIFKLQPMRDKVIQIFANRRSY